MNPEAILEVEERVGEAGTAKLVLDYQGVHSHPAAFVVLDGYIGVKSCPDGPVPAKLNLVHGDLVGVEDIPGLSLTTKRVTIHDILLDHSLVLDNTVTDDRPGGVGVLSLLQEGSVL